MLSSFLLYLACGAFSGFLAGILGGGGGIVVVPILIYTLPFLGVAEHIQHLALGTSLAIMTFTTLSSVRAHNAHQTVLWRVIFSLTPGIIAGTALGGLVATRIPTRPLSMIFVAFVFYMAFSMLFKKSSTKPGRHLPGMAGLFAAGSGIGFVSSFVGIGGGVMTVPFLLWCNVSMRDAVGTSAGVSVPIALFGALSYMANGWATPGLPEYALGFVFLPALAGVAAASIVTAPLGAAVGYRMQVDKVRKFFACFLLVIGCNLLWRLL